MKAVTLIFILYFSHIIWLSCLAVCCQVEGLGVLQISIPMKDWKSVSISQASDVIFPLRQSLYLAVQLEIGRWAEKLVVQSFSAQTKDPTREFLSLIH